MFPHYNVSVDSLPEMSHRIGDIARSTKLGLSYVVEECSRGEEILVTSAELRRNETQSERFAGR